MSDTKTITSSLGLKQGRVLRRYLDLAKFIELLRSQSLYFCRADQFIDKFEGAMPPVIREAINEAHIDGLINSNADDFYRKSRQSTFVSCWNASALDNMALWQLYGGDANSVAITSTVDRLLEPAFKWGEETEFQEVKYIDHSKNPNMIVGRSTDLFKFKHVAYKFENEVRIIVSRTGNWEQNPVGISLPLGDLNKIVRSVVVAPEAPAWFFELINDVSKKYGLTSPIRRSKLSYLP